MSQQQSEDHAQRYSNSLEAIEACFKCGVPDDHIRTLCFELAIDKRDYFVLLAKYVNKYIKKEPIFNQNKTI